MNDHRPTSLSRTRRARWLGVCALGLAAVLIAFAAPPPAPQTLIAISGDGSLTLRWEAVPGATSYTLGRRTSATTGNYTTVATGITALTHTDTGRTNGTPYYYIVTAIGPDGTSGPSNQARGTPVAALPAGTVVRWPLANSTAADADVIRYAFGPRNIGRYDFHAGLDLNAAQGTPVHAVMAGTVTNRIEWDGVTTGSGNNLLVSHGSGRWTAYLHLHGFAAGIGIGSAVSAGQVIGYVGKTGATSNHLHFTYFVGLASEASNEMRSRSPLELLPRTTDVGAQAVFSTNGSRTVDILIPAQQNTIRWIILRGAGVTRLVDYYDIVGQGSTLRDNPNQSGLLLQVAAPTIPYPGGGGTVQLVVSPDPEAPWGDFEPTRITVLDFHGNTLVDRTAYEAWKLTHGLALDAADDSDADADGLPLLVEYALELDPHVATWVGAPQFVRADADRVEFTYRRRRSELTYTVEASTDLLNWSAADVTQEFAVTGDQVTATTTLDGVGRKFLRLSVTL